MNHKFKLLGIVLGILLVFGIPFASSAEPAITVVSPTNTTYTAVSIDLNWSANETLDDAKYELNGVNTTLIGDINTTATTMAGVPTTITIDRITGNDEFIFVLNTNGGRYTSIYNKSNQSLHTNITRDGFNLFADSNWLYVSDSGGNIHVLNLSNLSIHNTLNHGGDFIVGVHADDDYICGASYGGHIDLYNKTNMSIDGILPGAGQMYACYIGENNIYGGGQTDIVYVFNKGNKSSRINLSIGGSDVYGIFEFGDYLAIASLDGWIYVFDVSNSFAPLANLTDGGGIMYDVQMDANYIYGANADNNAYVWNRNNFALRNTLTDASDEIEDIYIDAINIYGAGYGDNVIYVWEINRLINTTITAIDGSNTLYVWGNKSGDMNYTKVVFTVSLPVTPTPTPDGGGPTGPSMGACNFTAYPKLGFSGSGTPERPIAPFRVVIYNQNVSQSFTLELIGDISEYCEIEQKMSFEIPPLGTDQFIITCMASNSTVTGNLLIISSLGCETGRSMTIGPSLDIWSDLSNILKLLASGDLSAMTQTVLGVPYWIWVIILIIVIIIILSLW